MRDSLAGAIDFCYLEEAVPEEYWDYGGLLLKRPPSWLVALNKNLPDEEAELTAAHELLHARLSRRGFLGVASRVGFLAPLASCFSSALSDPLIDRLMLEEGFDVEKLWRREWGHLGESFPGDVEDREAPAFEVEVLRLLRYFPVLQRLPWEGLKNYYQNRLPPVWEGARKLIIELPGKPLPGNPGEYLYRLKNLVRWSHYHELLELTPA